MHIPRNQCSPDAGAAGPGSTHPAATRHPSQEGIKKLPSLEGWPKAGVGWPSGRQTTPCASHITHVIRFLTCRRGVVALESAIAVIPLIICLVGVFEIVQTVFVRDLMQRAAYRVAYANALHDSAARNKAQLKAQCLQAMNAEVGDFLSFDLAGEGSCGKTPAQDSIPADFCLKVTITVYDNPSDLLNNTASKGRNAKRGGDAGDMVVVKVVATPRSVLSQLQQSFFGEDGLTVTAVRRNERLETA